MGTSILLKAAYDLFEVMKIMDKTVDKSLPREIAGIVKFHSKGSAIAGIAGGGIPAVGPVVAGVISAGFIWTMYVRINSKIDLPLSENILKSLASGVATNIVTQVVGIFALATVSSLIPVLGNAVAIVVMGSTVYGITLAAGFVYLKILTRVFKSGKDPSSLTAENLKNVANEIVQNENIKSVMKEAKKEYKAAKARGEIQEELKNQNIVAS